MSLYKYGISDKTIGAMQNSDPEVQQMLENAQQNNQTQPPASNGIMDIIKELFGFGDAQSSDLGEIANLQSILNPITPELMPERKGPFGGPFRPELNDPYRSVIELMPDPNFPQFAKTDMGATGTVPKLKEGILSQAQPFQFLSSAYEDLDEDAGQVDYLPGQEPSGIAKLLDYVPFVGEKSLGGALLRNFLPKSDPRATNMRNFYENQYGLTSSGSLASGIMAGYNPVSGGFLNKITGGRFGQPTQYGLADAARRRINRIANRKIAQTDASRAKIAALQKFAREDTISRARQANPGVYEGRSGGFDTSAADRAGTSAGSGQGFSNKSGRGRTGY